MNSSSENSYQVTNSARHDKRNMSTYPRQYISVKPLDNSRISGALIIDTSEHGLGVVCSCSYPLGTRIAISIDNKYNAVGEIVDVKEDFGEWGWSGMVRMGIHFIDKGNWPSNN